MKIVRKLLTPDELQSPGTRYDVDCNCIQRTVDGATWRDAPGDDPRHADSWRLPPIVADDPRCQAAANMADLVKQTIDRFVTTAGVASASTGMLDLWLLAVGPVGWVIDLIVILAESLFAIGIVAIELTFTSTVYDELKCIFYCHIDVDGQCSTTQLSSILDDIHALGDGVIDGVMDNLLNTWGEVGLSNAGALGDITDGDCSACECTVYCHEWFDIVGVTDIFSFGGNTYTRRYFASTPSATVHITKIVIDYEQTPSPGNTFNAAFVITYNQDSVDTNTADISDSLSGQVTFTPVDGQDYDIITFDVRTAWTPEGAGYPNIPHICVEYSTPDITWTDGSDC